MASDDMMKCPVCSYPAHRTNIAKAVEDYNALRAERERTEAALREFNDYVRSQMSAQRGNQLFHVWGSVMDSVVNLGLWRDGKEATDGE